MTARKTLDQMSSDDLDQLHAEIDQAREGEAILGARVNEWVALARRHQHWGQRRWNAWKSARARAKEQRDRAERAEAAIARVRALHVARDNGTCAARCYSSGMAPEPWPCPTIRALDEPAPGPAATQTTDASERCCVCGGGPVTYHNYRDQPFCWPCADCQCNQEPCVRTGVNDPSASQAAAVLREVLATFRAVTDDATRTLVGYVSAPIHPDDMDRWRSTLPKEQP